MDKINTGVDKDTRAKVIKSLNALLSDQYVLVVKLKKYHWNVKGNNFYPLHLLFDSQYEIMLTIIDDTAEVIRQLGGESLGSMQAFIDGAFLKEDNGIAPEADTMSLNLTNDHEAVVRNMRDLIATDEVQAITEVENFLQDLVHKHGKMAWFIRSYNL